MKEFKYDVVQLIQCVKERPCLWDRTIENYKDKVERKMAWEEIFGIVDDGYEEMSAEDKRLTGEVILNKWTNIRDTFLKTLKNRVGKPKRKYVYYEQLKFLLKILKCEETHSGEDIGDYEVEEPETSYKAKKRKRKVDYDDDYQVPVSRNRVKEDSQSSNDLDLEEINMTNEPRVMNEDEAFFASLLPTIVRYNEDERLEFRLEVLSLMKRIKDKRKWTINE